MYLTAIRRIMHLSFRDIVCHVKKQFLCIFIVLNIIGTAIMAFKIASKKYLIVLCSKEFSQN